MSGPYFGKRTFCLITGGNQNIGRSVALQLAAKLAAGSVVVLTARNLAKLNAVRAEVAALNAAVSVHVVSLDLLVAAETDVERLLAPGAAGRPFDAAILVHCATYFDRVHLEKRARDTDALAPLLGELHANVGVFVCLTTAFVRAFAASRKLVVNLSDNITDITEGYSVYLTCQAARQMFMKALVVESDEGDRLRLVNYAPGLIDTSLIDGMIPITWSQVIKDGLNGPRMTPDQTIKRLCEYLEKDEFENGGVIMYDPSAKWDDMFKKKE